MRSGPTLRCETAPGRRSHRRAAARQPRRVGGGWRDVPVRLRQHLRRHARPPRRHRHHTTHQQRRAHRIHGSDRLDGLALTRGHRHPRDGPTQDLLRRLPCDHQPRRTGLLLPPAATPTRRSARGSPRPAAGPRPHAAPTRPAANPSPHRLTTPAPTVKDEQVINPPRPQTPSFRHSLSKSYTLPFLGRSVGQLVLAIRPLTSVPAVSSGCSPIRCVLPWPAAVPPSRPVRPFGGWWVAGSFWAPGC